LQRASAAAITVSVLQCLTEPPAFLHEVRGVLSADGSLLLGVKAVPGTHTRSSSAHWRSWFAPIKRHASKRSYLHRFTGAGLRELLLSSSFTPLSETEADGWLWVIAVAA
jgi:hypothetical protein